LRFEDPAVPALGALAGLREAAVVEREAARSAARRQYDNSVAGGFGGPNHVAERVLYVGAREAELAGEARHRSRLTRQVFDELLAKRQPHRYTLTP